MDFTREPIIESIITPKSGCKLVVRSSKSAGQEEYFVDAVEMVSFGNALFFRSVERPKAFIVPANDYEVIEVREARLVLKNVGVDRTIKIGGGREQKAAREVAVPESLAAAPELEQPAPKVAEVAETKNGRQEKRKEKRSKYRRRRGGEIVEETQEGQKPIEISPEVPVLGEQTASAEKREPGVSSLLPPPPTLISETIARYRENVLFKDAFFIRGEGQEDSEEEKSEGEGLDASQEQSEELLEALEMQKISLEPSSYGSFEPEEEEQLQPGNSGSLHDEEFPEPREE